MTSNYLEIKYPNNGYKETVSSANNPKYHSLSNMFKKETQEEKETRQKKEIIISSIPKHKCTNVCECGEEWESLYSYYQEGCYPYIIQSCNKCNEKSRLEELKIKMEVLKQRKIDGFNESLPPRFKGKLTSVENRSLLDSNCSIIWGGFGVGKTWECYTLAKELIIEEKIKTWKLITEMDLILSLRDFDNQEYNIKRYKELDLLIIDETGKSNETDYNKSLMFSVLNYRYEWELKTVLICNAKSKEEIRNLVPTAILDRFRENVVEMNGNSKRYKERV